MSDIKVGDLVWIFRSCCERQDSAHKMIGSIFVVEKIYAANVQCSFCGWGGGNEITKAIASHKGAPLEWLKKIPPLGELEGEKRATRRLRRERRMGLSAGVTSKREI